MSNRTPLIEVTRIEFGNPTGLGFSFRSNPEPIYSQLLTVYTKLPNGRESIVPIGVSASRPLGEDKKLICAILPFRGRDAEFVLLYDDRYDRLYYLVRNVTNLGFRYGIAYVGQ